MTDSMMTKSRSLEDWLCYFEHQHQTTIDLGLERVGAVARKMGLTSLVMPVITVAGTNGKGSTCRLIEQLLLAKGYQVGVYSSPHISDYRERVRINDQLPPKQAFCDAFAAIEEARGDISLTYFEVGTLVALWLFRQSSPDYVVLEVGLGGRLDATNIIDADVAVVTTIALDHESYLGSDVMQIGREKAGIFRRHGRAVTGDPEIVSSVIEAANQLSCQLLANGHQVHALFDEMNQCWSYQGAHVTYRQLPIPHLPVDNAVAALAALEHLDISLPETLVQQVIGQWQLAGRMQLLQHSPEVFIDVAHNPQSAEYLAKQLTRLPKVAHTIAVCGMLADKDNQHSVNSLIPCFDHWFIAGLGGERGDNGDKLATALENAAMTRCQSIQQAYEQAMATAQAADRVVVFGSFVTVAAILAYRGG
ncbi:bifunctional tetrahydrofolate synthase/dihydrofolate synthase [Celerinatantimonas sp. YJH-8]|uniref:bifunctional tetrahydrofolate synthase/dihydrofolate synthase n=1 Tax=Celerinatantimonas sp. YJH-8 TaxID=3228714 RepID=UPI0038C50E43